MLFFRQHPVTLQDQLLPMLLTSVTLFHVLNSRAWVGRQLHVDVVYISPKPSGAKCPVGSAAVFCTMTLSAQGHGAAVLPNTTLCVYSGLWWVCQSCVLGVVVFAERTDCGNDGMEQAGPLPASGPKAGCRPPHPPADCPAWLCVWLW